MPIEDRITQTNKIFVRYMHVLINFFNLKNITASPIALPFLIILVSIVKMVYYYITIIIFFIVFIDCFGNSNNKDNMLNINNSRQEEK